MKQVELPKEIHAVRMHLLETIAELEKWDTFSEDGKISIVETSMTLLSHAQILLKKTPQGRQKLNLSLGE